MTYALTTGNKPRGIKVTAPTAERRGFREIVLPTDPRNRLDLLHGSEVVAGLTTIKNGKYRLALLTNNGDSNGRLQRLDLYTGLEHMPKIFPVFLSGKEITPVVLLTLKGRYLAKPLFGMGGYEIIGSRDRFGEVFIDTELFFARFSFSSGERMGYPSKSYTTLNSRIAGSRALDQKDYIYVMYMPEDSNFGRYVIYIRDLFFNKDRVQNMIHLDDFYWIDIFHTMKGPVCCIAGADLYGEETLVAIQSPVVEGDQPVIISNLETDLSNSYTRGNIGMLEIIDRDSKELIGHTTLVDGDLKFIPAKATIPTL